MYNPKVRYLCARYLLSDNCMNTRVDYNGWYIKRPQCCALKLTTKSLGDWVRMAMASGLGRTDRWVELDHLDAAFAFQKAIPPQTD